MPGKPALRVPQTQSLKSGDTSIYSQDLVALLLKPLKPGKYLIEAIYRLPDHVFIRSNRLSIEVVAEKREQSIGISKVLS